MQIPNFTRHALAGAALAMAAAAAPAATLVGLTSANQVALIDTANVAGATMVAITGLAAGDRFVGIDLRPSNNTIYGITLGNGIYTLNPTTGAATFVTALTGATVSPTLAYGIDFNPVADFSGAASLRFISSAGANLAVNVATGVAGNTANTIASGYTSVAYTNSGTTAPASTALYYIDSNADTLSMAATAFNTPTITTLGSLGLDVLKAGGFDIQANGQAWAALLTDGGTANSGIYSINLATGAATLSGTFAGTLTGLTAAPVPEAGTWALMAGGLLALAGLKSRRSVN
jgi:hypothetical protein